MAVILGELYREYKDRYQLSWMAGRDGGGRNVSSVYIAEDLENSSFLKGGELVITTGMESAGTQDWLFRLLRILVRQKSAGVILNIGKYIHREDLQAELLTFCERENFPVLLMPWKIHISDITQNFWDRILQSKQREDSLSLALREVIYDQRAESSAGVVLQENGFLPEDFYTGAVMCLFNENGEKKKAERQQIRNIIGLPLSGFRDSAAAFLMQDALVFVWKNVEKDAVADVLREIVKRGQRLLPEGHIVTGIGNTLRGYGGIRKSCFQAGDAMNAAQCRQQDFLFFSDLGLLQILLQVQDKELLKEYEERQIGPLLVYDRRHDSGLAETLRKFLFCEGRFQDTAEALNCHRNTVVYRIGKIRELLGCDLHDGKVCFELQTALEIETYFQIFGEDE